MTRAGFSEDELDVIRLASDVKRLSIAINAGSAALLRPLGITPVQADALLILNRLGPTTLRELGNHLVAEAGHPSRLMSRLEADGWVERRRSDTDRRALQIELTDAGRALLDRISEVHAPLFRSVSEEFGPKITETGDLLRQMREHLESHIERL